MTITYSVLLGLYDRSLADFWRYLDLVGDDDLRAATPCVGWDVSDLLRHVVDENGRFRTAVASTGSTAGLGPTAGGSGPAGEWEGSVAALREAFRDADPAAPVQLDGYPDVTVEIALQMQLLDTVVHAWDLAAALGHDHRPDDELVELVAGSAGFIAQRSPDGTPGVFAAPTTASDGDRWAQALADLGRGPLPAA